MRNSTLTAKNSKINKKRVNLETFVFAVNEHMHYSNSPTHFFNQLFSVNVQAYHKKQNSKTKKKKKKTHTQKCSTSSLLPVPSLVKLSVAKPGRHLMKHKLDALSWCRQFISLVSCNKHSWGKPGLCLRTPCLHPGNCPALSSAQEELQLYPAAWMTCPQCRFSSPSRKSSHMLH